MLDQHGNPIGTVNPNDAIKLGGVGDNMKLTLEGETPAAEISASMVEASNLISNKELMGNKEIGTAPYDPSKVVVIDFHGGGKIILPFTEYSTEQGVAKSISKIMPMEGEVLVAEYGRIGLMRVLNSSRGVQDKEPVSATLMIVGLGDAVPAKFQLGMIIIPKSAEGFQIRDTWDPNNKMSYPALIEMAKENKVLLAASSIAVNKSSNQVGLRADSVFINEEALEKANKLKAGVSVNNLLFKDEKVNFLNYKLTHYTNIAAIVVK